MIDNYKTYFENLLEGILITDKDGRILYFNKSYGDFIKQKLHLVQGKRLSQIRPGARLPEVLSRKKAITGIVRKEWEEEYLVNIYPLLDEGRLIGAISIVTFIKDALVIKEKLKEIESKSSYLNRRLLENNGTRYNFEHIIAQSPESQQSIALAKRVASHDADVLIQGESGCGKELYAQSIHNASDRKNKPFVAINCSALPKDILESELFGYEEGAFTGSKQGGKEGIFEVAQGGTIFLDEISEMDLEIQAKLLRVLEERKFRKLGGTKEKAIDVRIISACNVDLIKYIEEEKFRKDLYYRIAVFPIYIKPLRERKADIPLLVDNFLFTISKRLKKDISLSDPVNKVLYHYDWPGNIRELKNVLEFSSLMADSDIIELDHLPNQLTVEHKDKVYTCGTLSERVNAFERKEIDEALKYFGNTVEGKKKAAECLGISLASLYNKLNR